ncbi:hypothetical protein [Bacteroides ovatus]|uniref:hypothetical protein n=1 Tax=Bacteroides ovatus TaxID=28116 RepID=UPI001C318E2D|nr:hypothetical protein [Bacteroides ovatus]
MLWNVHIRKRRGDAENIKHRQCSFPYHWKQCRSILSGVQLSQQQIDFVTLLVHPGKGIGGYIQRITGKCAGGQRFILVYDRILPEIQRHQFLIHIRPPVLFSFFSYYIIQM